MTEKVITCITCPIGCNITVQGQGELISSLVGNQCKRGETYAKNEFVRPLRILTTTIKVAGKDVLVPVRSDKPIPKELQLECMELIKNTAIHTPICRYNVVIPDILGTGANIVATGEIKV